MNNTICRTRRAHAYFKLLVVMLLAGANSACDKSGFNYDMTGTDQQTNYIVADTLTIDMKTVRLDSIPTSGTGTLLCGINQDPYFGKATASTFFQLQLPTSGSSLDATATYDSVELILYTNKQLYGDSTATQNINVYEVVQTIKKAENSSYLYNNSNFQTGSQPIGSIQQVVRPNVDTSLRIKLPAAYGNTLFQLFKNKDNAVSTQDIFLQTYKGLALKPGSNSNNIIGFHTADTSVILRMHYHIKEEIPTDRHLDMNLYNEDVQFNQVTADRAGTVLAALSPTNKSISSTLTGNMSFVQPLSGVVTRIDLPTLKSLASVGKFFKVMRATLTVQPVAGTYRNYYSLPPNLTLCEADESNNVVDTLTAVTGGVQYGNLAIDYQYNINTAYTYDITHYCINAIASADYNSYGILITPPRGAYLTSFNRAVLADNKNKEVKIRIQVYYLLYN